MSELKAYKGDVYIPVYGSIADAKVYLKKDVDAVDLVWQMSWMVHSRAKYA